MPPYFVYYPLQMKALLDSCKFSEINYCIGLHCCHKHYQITKEAVQLSLSQIINYKFNNRCGISYCPTVL